MEQGDFECWVDVPETKGILQVSNRGRLRRLARKTKRGRSIVVVFASGDVRLVCDYKTSRFGWWVYYDGEKHFFARDDLEALFPEGVRNVDRSADAELKRLRDETFVENAEINGRWRKPKEEGE